MKVRIVEGGRRAGKTIAADAALSSYLKRNPRAVIATVRNGETIIEKPVDRLPLPQIEQKP